MSPTEHLGLRLVMWVAMRLLRDALTDMERKQLEDLRTTLAVLRTRLTPVEVDR